MQPVMQSRKSRSTISRPETSRHPQLAFPSRDDRPCGKPLRRFLAKFLISRFLALGTSVAYFGWKMVHFDQIGVHPIAIVVAS